MIAARGCAGRAAANVALCLATLQSLRAATVLALSSGFMTRPLAVQPAYARHRQRLASDRRTLVRLPSLDCDTCAASACGPSPDRHSARRR